MIFNRVLHFKTWGTIIQGLWGEKQVRNGLFLALVSSQDRHPGTPLRGDSGRGSCRGYGTEGHPTGDTRARP